jgi:transcriptional regulator with XRE-family HTH domain
MNQLAIWMSANSETDKTLAPKVEISRVQVSRIRRGIQRPRRELALRLEAVTQIPASDFIFGDAA